MAAACAAVAPAIGKAFIFLSGSPVSLAPRSKAAPSFQDADPKTAILARARALGFSAAGIAPADMGGAAADGLMGFLAQGFHGDMDWLAARAKERATPQGLWPAAKSAVVLAMNYGPPSDPRALLAQKDRGAVSVYARNRDYHDEAKKRLRQLARWMAETFDCQVKLFVDTAPVMEKPLAQAGGLGWQGKHTNLVSRDFGSWLFLGEIFTDLDLPPDRAESDHCGTCHDCLDACPTAAFPAPHQLDARRCISYLTIENKGHIPAEFRAPMGNRIYGCDDCLAACPWNKYAVRTADYAFLPRVELTAPKLAELAGLDDAGFRQVFSGSPIKRIGRDRFVRNVLIAIGNSGDVALCPVAQTLADDQSPLVRAMAAWALKRLLPAHDFAVLAAARADEPDEAVRAEWAA
jgi:epoxyqueuosine reductase